MQSAPTAADRAASAKMECFEAIRGLASLSVVVGHFILGFWPALYGRTGPRWELYPSWLKALAHFPGKYLWRGETAVAIFFVLSGFVLSLSFFKNGSAPALGSAAIRRYPRLMFPVCASILLAFILLQTGAMRNQDVVRSLNEAQGLAVDPLARNSVSNNWLRAYYGFSPNFLDALGEGTWGVFTTSNRYNLVLWTMPIELIGSFLVFGFLALGGALRNRWILYGILGGLLLAGQHFFYLDFLLGMALCDAWVYNQKTKRWRLPLAPALGLLALAVFVVPWRPVVALMVVGVTAASPRIQQLLSTRGFVFLGRVSFGLYLVHMPVFCSLGCSLYMLLHHDLGWSYTAGSVAAALVSLLGSVFMAWLFYQGIDRPTIALTRWLDSWLFRPKTVPPLTVNQAEPPTPLARAA